MIGLASPNLTNNYGTKLQAFALQQAVTALGYENEIIQFTFKEKRRSIKNVITGDSLRYRLHRMKHVRESNDTQIQQGFSERKLAFQRFSDEKYVFSEKCDTLDGARKLSEKYKAIICGSDQIWLPSNVAYGFYTLDFVADGVKRIAYAPSFGISEIPYIFRKDYRNFLNRMDVMTAREQRGSELVTQLTGKECPVVADPTLLLTKQQWINHLKLDTAKEKAPYVFAYFLGENEEHRKIAQEYAKHHGCKLVILPHVNSVVPADILYSDEAPYNVTPKDFVELIANARAVFTDSFHGSVFSILFERELFVFERFQSKSKQSTNSRIYSLLRLTGLCDRLILGSDGRLPSDCTPISYDIVNTKIESLRSNSLEILRGALEDL